MLCCTLHFALLRCPPACPPVTGNGYYQSAPETVGGDTLVGAVRRHSLSSALRAGAPSRHGAGDSLAGVNRRRGPFSPIRAPWVYLKMEDGGPLENVARRRLGSRFRGSGGRAYYFAALLF